MCVCSDAQSCLILCDLMDCSPPGSSVLGIFLARILELVAISYPRGSSQPRGPTCVSYVSCIGMWSLSQRHLGIPESIQSNNIVKSTNPFKLLDFLHSTILDFKILKKKCDSHLAPIVRKQNYLLVMVLMAHVINGLTVLSCLLTMFPHSWTPGQHTFSFWVGWMWLVPNRPYSSLLESDSATVEHHLIPFQKVVGPAAGNQIHG